MILFVFEGVSREPAVFKTLEHLFFERKKDRIICSYGNNIYQLYSQMTENGTLTDPDYYLDIVSVLKEKYGDDEDNPVSRIESVSDVSETYLFFDYDIHNQNRDRTLTYEELNGRLQKMIEFFDNETENGKLFVSYPMIESIRYTRKLPDAAFYKYTVSVEDLKSFKEISAEFSYYANLDFLCFHCSRKSGRISIKSEEEERSLRDNWFLLVRQNVAKASYICSGQNLVPESAEMLSQLDIFKGQIEKYLPCGCISILSSFPLFLFDYFPVSFFRD